jgi:hypothetical protein
MAIDAPMNVGKLLTAVLQMQMLNTAHIKALARSHADLLSALNQNKPSEQLRILTDQFSKEYNEISAWLLDHFVELKDLVDVDKILNLRKPGDSQKL